MENIIHGDCLLELKKIESETAQIIICDPPYNIGKNFGNNKYKMNIKEYLEWCDVWIDECVRILKKDGTMFIYGFSETLAEISSNIQIDLNKKWLVWHYTNKTAPSLNFWQKSHESILVVWKEDKVFNKDLVRVPYTGSYLKADGKTRNPTIGRFSDGTKTTKYKVNPLGALPRDVIKIPSLAGGGKERVNHPTQKPLDLCETLINSCKQEYGIVLIPFGGSGSECVIAKKHNLDFTVIEMNMDYINIIKSRLVNTIKIEKTTSKFDCESWKNTEAYKSFQRKPTQYDYYLENGSSSEILEIVKMNSKVFGTMCEKLLIEILGLSPRTSTQNDATYTFNETVYKFEIKVGRFLSETDDCMWQHIEDDHDFDFIILCLVNFTGFDVYFMTKQKVLDLISKNVIKKQGKQGFICKKNQIFKYLTKIENNIDEIFKLEYI
jgi:site-specific DNA-methyltransferase (adenine-specific)